MNNNKLTREEAQQRGVNAFYSKPMDIRVVVKEVRKVLDEAKA